MRIFIAFIVLVAGFIILPTRYAHAEVSYVDTIGSFGLGDGQFGIVTDVAIDSENNIYASGLLNVVQKFTSDGVFIAKWGSIDEGDHGDGEFDELGPSGIAVDSNDNVYVVDPGNNRIQKFTSDGEFITKWGSGGQGDGEFMQPYGVYIDKDDNVYVTDTLNYRIQKFTSDGEFITKWGSQGTGDGEFMVPTGIVVDSMNNVIVSEFTGDRIQKFTSDGEFITKWGSSGNENGEFNLSMLGVAVDNDDNVYVADSGNNRIQKFTSDGEFITKWGSSGNENGEFNNPLGMAFMGSKNYLYIADSNNTRIEVFYDSDGGEFNSDFGNPDDSIGENNHIAVRPGKAKAPSCGDSEPEYSPDLFQIDTNDSQATLYFAPTKNSDKYFITYGYEEGDTRFGVEFDFPASTGVIPYTINHLSPNTTYFFTVRAGNGCATGWWSKTMSAKTTGGGNILNKFFAYFN